MHILALKSYLNLNFAVRCEAMKAENEAAAAEDMQKELEDLKQRCKKLTVMCKLLNPCLDLIPASVSVFAHLFYLGAN